MALRSIWTQFTFALFIPNYYKHPPVIDTLMTSFTAMPGKTCIKGVADYNQCPAGASPCAPCILSVFISPVLLFLSPEHMVWLYFHGGNKTVLLADS